MRHAVAHSRQWSLSWLSHSSAQAVQAVAQSEQSSFEPERIVSMQRRQDSSHSRQSRTHSSIPAIPSQASPHFLQASAQASQLSIHSFMVISVCIPIHTPTAVQLRCLEDATYPRHLPKRGTRLVAGRRASCPSIPYVGVSALRMAALPARRTHRPLAYWHQPITRNEFNAKPNLFRCWMGSQRDQS